MLYPLSYRGKATTFHNTRFAHAGATCVFAVNPMAFHSGFTVNLRMMAHVRR